jgi:hypothetical protein
LFAKVTTLILLFSLLFPVSNGMAADDVTPPKLASLSLSGTKATIGESITLSAEILEDESGVDIAEVYYSGPTGYSKKVNLSLNAESSKYEGSFDVSTYDGAGVWKISSIYLKDKQGNKYSIYNRETVYQGLTYEYRNLSQHNIEVYGTLIDETAPRLGDLALSSTRAAGGESITVSADIIEEGSGVEYVHVSFVPPNGDSEGGKGIEMAYNQETGKFEGTFYADPYDTPGIWSIGTIQMGDKLYNHYSYRNGQTPSQEDYYEVKDFSAYNIEIVGTVGDLTPPTLNGFSVSKTAIMPGEQAQLLADISDDHSGVDHVYVFYNAPVGNEYKDVELTYNIETARYEGIFETSLDDPAGTWPLYAIEVIDNKGNFYTYYNSLEGSKGRTFEHRDLSQNNILVTVPDTSTPVTSINVQGQTGNNGWYGSGVTVSLTAADNESGTEKTHYRINGGEWQSYAEPFSISVEGSTVIEYKSIDKDGNEEAVKARTINIDTQKPVTAIGDIPSYTVKVDVPISFSTSDGTSGIARTEYRVNGGNWTTYEAPTYVGTEGTNTVEYRSVDLAGNVEATKQVQVKIDKTKPVLNVTFNPSVLIGGTGKLVNVKAAVDARDALSGIASFELVSITSSQPDVVKGGKLPEPDIQGAEYGTADTDFYLRNERSGSDRIYTITYKTTDNAGNSTVTSSTIMVKKK